MPKAMVKRAVKLNPGDLRRERMLKVNSQLFPCSAITFSGTYRI